MLEGAKICIVHARLSIFTVAAATHCWCCLLHLLHATPIAPPSAASCLINHLPDLRALLCWLCVLLLLLLQRVYNREMPFKTQMLPFSLMMVMALASIGELLMPLHPHLHPHLQLHIHILEIRNPPCDQTPAATVHCTCSTQPLTITRQQHTRRSDSCLYPCRRCCCRVPSLQPLPVCVAC